MQGRLSRDRQAVLFQSAPESRLASLLFGGWLLPALGMGICDAAQPVVFEGDAVPLPLTASAPDATRGKAVIVQREKGHCILCHTLPLYLAWRANGLPVAAPGVRR